MSSATAPPNSENGNDVHDTRFATSLTLATMGIILSICNLLFYLYTCNHKFRSFVNKVIPLATYRTEAKYTIKEPEKNKESAEPGRAVNEPIAREEEEPQPEQRRPKSTLEVSNIYDEICENSPAKKTARVKQEKGTENQEKGIEIQEKEQNKASSKKDADSTVSRRNSTGDTNSLVEDIYSTISDNVKDDNCKNLSLKPKLPSIPDIYSIVTKSPTTTTFPAENPCSTEEIEESHYSAINEDRKSKEY